MPFVKLDCGIIHSSLWAEDSDTKICWITLLLLADATGFVRAAASAIAREAGISADVARRALDLFQGPDDESRTPDNQGKRIEKVDGGYRVLNYEKYRERDYTNAERQKRFRERKKSPMIDRIIERDGQRCGICGSDIELADIHIDHIVPLSRGGEDISENRQLAHQECNQRKSSTSDESLWRNSVMPLCRYVTRYITPRNTCRSRVQKQNKKQSASESRGECEEIYAAYPRKVAKPEALRAIQKAISRGTSASTLLESTKLFAVTTDLDVRYIPHPATWFNQERFNDDPATWRNGATTKPKEKAPAYQKITPPRELTPEEEDEAERARKVAREETARFKEQLRNG